jgi:enamine deaminase RidA (YjgF/YER057c/UK114 family)
MTGPDATPSPDAAPGPDPTPSPDGTPGAEGAVRAAAVRRVGSGGPWEGPAGYCRAVAAGDFIFVSGCTSVIDGQVRHEGDARAQTEQAIAAVSQALSGLGASLADVVRTRMFVTDISRWAEYGEAHGDAFGQAPPASTMVEVSALIEPRMLVEVEAVAFRPGVGAQPGKGQP